MSRYATSRVEPGLVLLCLLELRAYRGRLLTLNCGLADIPRVLRPRATVDGDHVRLPRAAALHWVESLAERLGPAMSRANSAHLMTQGRNQ